MSQDLLARFCVCPRHLALLKGWKKWVPQGPVLRDSPLGVPSQMGLFHTPSAQGVPARDHRPSRLMRNGSLRPR